MSAVFCKHVPDLKPHEKNHLRTIQTWLHECEIKLESTYNITRTRASEFLGFMISDVDRNYREEELYSIPIAYAMKGYSLSNQVMRNMMEFVLAECVKRGLYTPVCCFDGQWYKMTVRDGNDSPLTLLQLQKQTWNAVKKIDKKEILREISNSNVLSVTDIQSLAENVSIGKTIKTVTARDYYHTSRFSKVADVLVTSYSIGNVKDGRKFNVSAIINHMIVDDLTATKKKSKPQTTTKSRQEEEDETNKTKDIISSLPAEVELDLSEDVTNQVIEVALSLHLDNSDENVNHAVQEHFNISNLFNVGTDILTSTELNGQEKTDETEELRIDQPTDTTSDSIITLVDTINMLKEIKNDKKSWQITIEEFVKKFKDAKTIDSCFTKAELIGCMQPVFGKLKANGEKCSKSLSKHQLVTVMSKYLGDGTTYHHARTVRKNPNNLRITCKKNCLQDIQGCFELHIC